MIAFSVVAFSLVGSVLIWLAGRRDEARDPRLTLAVLGLLACFPLLSLLPKVEVSGLPAAGPAWTAWLGWAWAAGVLLFSIRLIVALVQLTLWRRRSIPVDHHAHGGCMVEIRMLDGLACPVAAGVLKPLILVPSAWREWSPALRETVIAHELCHHERRDPLWRSLAAVTCTLHWFNPLVWWMAVRLADQCEYACDERVVSHGLAAQAYARDLCDVAAICRAPATTLAMASRRGLESRVRRMLAPRQASPGIGLVCFMLLAVTGAVALAMIERGPAEIIPAVEIEEVRTRLSADPFPGN